MAAVARLVVDLDWPYDAALAAQHAARDAGAATVFLGSHREEVVTLGRHAPESQLLRPAALEERGVLVRRIERGGGATAHGPGQLVIYPVIKLLQCGLDVPSLTMALLEATADLCREEDIEPDVVVEGGGAGVYVGGAKLASIGFRVEHDTVTHGLAVNVDNDLSLFDLIAPCGRAGAPMTSLQRLRGAGAIPLSERARRLAFHVARRCMLAFEVTPLTGNERHAGLGGAAHGGFGSGSGTGAIA